MFLFFRSATDCKIWIPCGHGKLFSNIDSYDSIPTRDSVLSGKKTTGTFSLKGLLPYRKRIPALHYFFIIPLLLIWTAVIFSFLAPLDNYLMDKLFFFIPDWFNLSNMDLSPYSKTVLVITWFTGLVLNGVLAPIVEELYFRGYLLPRLSRFKSWSVLLNAGLFSVYHFFSPWQNITRILGLLPMVYVVWWKKNMYISIYTHITVNTLSALVMAHLYLK